MTSKEATNATLLAARRFYDRHSTEEAVAATYGYFTHHPFARLNRKRLHLISDLVARQSSAIGRPLRVLDLASGGGLITCALAAQGHRAVGLDLSEDEIRMAKMFASEEGSDCEFAQADLVNDDDWELTAQRLLGGKPDVTTLAYALHHFPPDEVARFVSRLSKLLDEGAQVVVNEENLRSPVFRAKHWLRARIQQDTDTEWQRRPSAWRSVFSANQFAVDSPLVGADMTPIIGALAPGWSWSVLFTAVRR